MIQEKFCRAIVIFYILLAVHLGTIRVNNQLGGLF